MDNTANVNWKFSSNHNSLVLDIFESISIPKGALLIIRLTTTLQTLFHIFNAEPEYYLNIIFNIQFRRKSETSWKWPDYRSPSVKWTRETTGVKAILMNILCTPRPPTHRSRITRRGRSLQLAAPPRNAGTTSISRTHVSSQPHFVGFFYHEYWVQLSQHIGET